MRAGERDIILAWSTVNEFTEDKQVVLYVILASHIGSAMSIKALRPRIM
jgi:hypothetical protein